MSFNFRPQVSEIDKILEDSEADHHKSLDELKQSYAIKMRSMEESKRKEQERDSEALGIGRYLKTKETRSSLGKFFILIEDLKCEMIGNNIQKMNARFVYIIL